MQHDEAPLIVCSGLSLSYDGRRDAVRDVSFTVDKGSVFALVGPNGAGKTSTLRMLATLSRPTAGQILVGGMDAVASPEAAR